MRCCGTEAVWVENVPGKGYHFCRECKNEVPPESLQIEVKFDLPPGTIQQYGRTISIDESVLSLDDIALLTAARTPSPARKRGKILSVVGPELTVGRLIEILGQMPADAVVRDWRREFHNDEIQIKLRHPSMPEVPEGGLYPLEVFEC